MSSDPETLGFLWKSVRQGLEREILNQSLSDLTGCRFKTDISKKRLTRAGLAFLFSRPYECVKSRVEILVRIAWVCHEGSFYFSNKWHSDTMVSLTAPFSRGLLQVLCVAIIRPVSNRRTRIFRFQSPALMSAFLKREVAPPSLQCRL